jgi:hypothetical protein
MFLKGNDVCRGHAWTAYSLDITKENTETWILLQQIFCSLYESILHRRLYNADLIGIFVMNIINVAVCNRSFQWLYMY